MSQAQGLSPKAKSGQKKKKPTTGSDPIDVGTPEFSRRFTLKPELVGAASGHAVHLRVMDETVCDRLLLKNRISLREHQISEKVHADLRRANFSKIGTSKLEPSSGTPDPHASMLTDHLVEVGKLFQHLDEHVGRPVRHMVTNVCLDIRDVHSDTELELFRLGLLAVALKLERRRAKA